MAARVIAALLLLLLPGVARAEDRKGTLALLNIGKEEAGIKATHLAGAALKPHVGGWARQQKIAEFLAGAPLEADAMPEGAAGEDLERLVLAARGADGPPDKGDLGNLGQLLGVDYLLLIKVKGERLTAQLFSVPGRQFGPRGFDEKLGEGAETIQRLKAYVLDQSGQKKKAALKKGFWGKRWWIWAVAGAVAVAGVVLIFALPEDTTGDLKIRVTR